MLLKIDHHISHLLYHHDCVIVPGLGGFVTNLQSAKIHPVQHQFYPPSKSLGFNVHLKRNDGLVANSVAQTEEITYDEALQLITEFVNNCNANLNNNKGFYIEKIGKLYYDVEKHIRFEADTTTNYLPDSFGLIVIQSPPVKRDTLKEKVEKQVKYREPIKPEVSEKKRFPWKTALILPVIGLFMWASVQTWNVYKNKSDTGNLNPFENTSKPKKEIKEQTAPVVIQEIVPKPETSVEENLPAEIKSETLVSEEPKTETQAEAITTSKISSSIEAANKKYFVIAGAFAVPQNAEKLISQLKQKGFVNAAIIDTTKQGLHVVAYNEGFLSYHEALQTLNSLKAEENSAAWLMRK